MSKPTPWKDEYTLLCERCGYVVEGLDQSLPCPECGKPIFESLPERRVGTPWQQKRNFRTLWQTWLAISFHPIRTFDILYVGNGVSDSGIIHSLKFTAVVTTGLVFALNFAFYSFGKLLISSIFILFFGALIGLLAISIGFALTAVEQQGLKLIGKTRGYRITEQIAQAVVNHACIGWGILGISMGTGLLLVYYGSIVSTQEYTSRADYAMSELLFKWGTIIILAGGIPGFLVFELFAYLGLRRCKYANTLPTKERADG